MTDPTKARIVAEVRAAVKARDKEWERAWKPTYATIVPTPSKPEDIRVYLHAAEDAALERAAERIRTLSFAYDTKRHMGLPDPCAVLDEAAAKVLALKSSASKPEAKP